MLNCYFLPLETGVNTIETLCHYIAVNVLPTTRLENLHVC